MDNLESVYQLQQYKIWLLRELATCEKDRNNIANLHSGKEKKDGKYKNKCVSDEWHIGGKVFHACIWRLGGERENEAETIFEGLKRYQLTCVKSDENMLSHRFKKHSEYEAGQLQQTSHVGTCQ